MPPPFDWHVDERVENGESHEGDDGGDDEAEAEVDVDDVVLVQAKSSRSDHEIEFCLKGMHMKVVESRQNYFENSTVIKHLTS